MTPRTRSARPPTAASTPPTARSCRPPAPPSTPTIRPASSPHPKPPPNQPADLDRWNLGLIAASAPGFASGKAVQYCAPETFTSPVNIKRLVASIPNAEYACPDADDDATCGWVPHTPGTANQAGVCTAAITAPPCTGLDTDQVKALITEMAVEFFGANGSNETVTATRTPPTTAPASPTPTRPTPTRTAPATPATRRHRARPRRS